MEERGARRDGTWRAFRTRTERPFIVKMAVPRPAMFHGDLSPRSA